MNMGGGSCGYPTSVERLRKVKCSTGHDRVCVRERRGIMMRQHIEALPRATDFASIPPATARGLSPIRPHFFASITTIQGTNSVPPTKWGLPRATDFASISRATARGLSPIRPHFFASIPPATARGLSPIRTTFFASITTIQGTNSVPPTKWGQSPRIVQSLLAYSYQWCTKAPSYLAHFVRTSPLGDLRPPHAELPCSLRRFPSLHPLPPRIQS